MITLASIGVHVATKWLRDFFFWVPPLAGKARMIPGQEAWTEGRALVEELSFYGWASLGVEIRTSSGLLQA